MKLYINQNLEVCANEKGWPDKPPLYFTRYTVNGETAETGQRAAELYTKALAQAKAESVPIDGGTIPGTLTHVLMTAEPDSFIEADIDVEFVTQYRKRDSNDEWSDHGNSYNFQETRRVARIKPASSAHGYSEGADLPSAPFPQNPQVSAVEGPWSSITESANRIEQGIKITNRLNADFDHMVNQQKIIDDLRAQLAAAIDTIANLEAENRNQFIHLQTKHDQLAAAEKLLLQETGKAMKYSQTIADLEKRVKELEYEIWLKTEIKN